MVQGATEFLPISSSGHLVFFQSLFGFEEPLVAFDVMLHLGTLLAVVLYLRRDLRQILGETMMMLKRKDEGKGGGSGVKLLLWIVVGTLPTGLMGILFKDWFESWFSDPRGVGLMLLVTGGVLWATRYFKEGVKKIDKMRWRDALIIGIAQGVAIIPGISRSGATICTGVFCRLDRELAGKFSFLLSIPAILGAAVLKYRKIDMGSGSGLFLIGAVAAFIVGYLSLRILMKMIKDGKLSGFSYYCWAMGIAMILLTR
jgi:undecaprenyl-diphosphatase